MVLREKADSFLTNTHTHTKLFYIYTFIKYIYILKKRHKYMYMYIQNVPLLFGKSSTIIFYLFILVSLRILTFSVVRFPAFTNYL